jgi:DNA-directed RNA polymerase subunit RPC12/RpoP
MSSSPRSDLYYDDEKLEILSEKSYACPECDLKTMKRVSGFCYVNEELSLKNLERFHCMSCGADFFDMAAMGEIRSAREYKKPGLHAAEEIL